MYIAVTYVDAVTKIVCTRAPMSHGPALPDLAGLNIEFGNESQWPTDRPVFYGTCSDTANLEIEGVINTFTQEEYDQIKSAELAARPVLPTAAELIIEATQRRLDEFAQTRNYDNILSACTYATDANPKFAAECQYCVEARSATWSKLYEILAAVEAGTRSAPAGYQDIESELPALAWPN
jgi:hypothetical protein